ncbi:hypothetical protein BOX15_Mlig023186g2, partial [Macrostomum lignano]
VLACCHISCTLPLVWRVVLDNFRFKRNKSLNVAKLLAAATGSQEQPPPECPMHAKTAASPAAAAPTQSANNGSGCPVNSDAGSGCPVNAGTDGQLDPLNMMPSASALQQPTPGQPFPLDTGRQRSSIPKASGNESEKWEYPSAQMFWNAMVRKGWRWENSEVTPETMDAIIRIHNANNELAWREVLKWEAYHARECPTPRLASFGGKATQLSPRAKFRYWLGYQKPFDRHDWIVDRCGRSVRYIIDYYDGKQIDENYEFAALDVRPALDSFTALRDRTKAAYMRWRYSGETEGEGDKTN